MADVFTPELTFGPYSSGIMTPDSPGRPYRTMLLGGTSDPSAGYALYLPFSADSPTYRVGSNTYSDPTTLQGYSYTRSGGKGEVEASDRTGQYARQPLLNQDFTTNVAGWTPTNLTATWQAANGGQALLTKTADGNAFAQSISNGLSAGLYRLRARITVSERVRVAINGVVGPAAGGYMFISSVPGTFDIDVVGTSALASGNLDVSFEIADTAVWAANGATVAVEYCNVDRVLSRVGYQGINEPAIIPSVGYWSRGALTNYLLRSQEFANAAWTTADGASVVETNAAAPDGTMTADTLTFGALATSQLYQGFAGPTGFNTPGVWARTTSGTKAFRIKLVTSGDIYSGDLTATTTWQFFAAPQTSASSAIQMAIANAVGGGAGSIQIWQAQNLNGNHPDGGPIIPTAGATAAIGADVFRHTLSAPTNVDQVFFAKISLPAVSASFLSVFTLDDGTNNNSVAAYLSSGDPYIEVQAAGVLVYGDTLSTLTANQDTILLLRRLGGEWRAGKVVAGVLTWGISSAAAFPAGMVNNRVAVDIVSGGQMQGIIRNQGHRVGTFTSDAEVIAAVSI